MTELNHITRDEIAAFVAGGMDASEAGRIQAHLDACGECAGALGSARDFVEGLDADWTRARLRAIGADHPTVSVLEAMWMDDSSRGDLEEARRHVEDCRACREHLDRLDAGFAALAGEDPLGRAPWPEIVRGKFAAGIEMMVEAGSGAFTSAAGLVRDVMTPQARTQLSPAQAYAMGGAAKAEAGVEWHDATFNTDELSGEVTGAADPNTGRGSITISINKSGTYVAVTPIVDLVNEGGEVVSTQYTLDLGDRYTAQFSGLVEGRYLVGIREPVA